MTLPLSFDGFMAAGGWVVLAVAATVFQALMLLITQYYKVPAGLLLFWIRLCLIFLLLPLLFAVPLPDNPWFYLTVFITACCALVGDTAVLKCSAQYGGGVTARMMPLPVLFSFVLWFAFEPELLYAYAARPVNTAITLAALGGCIYFARRQNACAVSRAALKGLLPALAAYTLIVVLNKYAMLQGQMTSTVWGYIFVQSVFYAVLAGGGLLWQGGRKALAPAAPAVFLPALGLGVLGWIGHMPAKNYAMVYTPNPSYVAAISLLAPVMIALYYKLRQHRETADPRAGMGVVFCAIVLSLAAVAR